MSDPIPVEIKSHHSYSALSDWLKCGKLYQLKRMVGLPDRPSWWNIGGHSVHAATEEYDRLLFAQLGI